MILAPSLPSFTSHYQPLANLVLFRNQSRIILYHGCAFHGKFQMNASSATKPTSQNGVYRRDLVLFGLSSSVALSFPQSGFSADEDLTIDTMVDDINAYSYTYPIELPSKKFFFKWVESRKPERYSSAAPLSPDARLRIVSERVDIVDNLIISVSVTSIELNCFPSTLRVSGVCFVLVQIGPPNSMFLKSTDKSTWSAKDVADSVLADKSALRVTSSQRMAESSVVDVHSSEIDGEPYWYYEYLVRKSPTKIVQESDTYRRYIASTTERDGYLYSLNASTLSQQWNTMGPILEKTVASFRLLPPTENYVPPFKDPWRFW